MVRNCSTSLALTSWNWICSTRDCAHSPSLPNLTSPSTVLNVLARVDVVGELLVLDALGRDRLLQHLELRVAKWGHVVAERVDAFGRRSRLISLDQILDTGELHLRYRQPPVVIDEAV